MMLGATRGKMAWVGAVAWLALGAGVAGALGAEVAHASDSRRELTSIRRATATYHDLRKARQAGYTELGACESDATRGAMGQHFIQAGLVDGKLEIERPEVLLYEPRGDRYQLVGVEYLISVQAWEGAGNRTPPAIAGHAFTRDDSKGIYKLHVWAWEHNPSGTFAPFNPAVSCSSEIDPDEEDT